MPMLPHAHPPTPRPAGLGALALVLAFAVLAAAVPATAQAPPPSSPPETFPARIELVGAEIFGIDRSHSYLGFSIGFLGVSRVRGTFRAYQATILYDDERPERSSVTVAIDPASIDTAGEMRDKDLKSANFFDVEKHGEIVFQSARIEPLGGERYRVHGTLTMKGVARPVVLEMTRTFRRAPDAAWGNIRMAVTGRTTLRRKDFGILGSDFWGDKVLTDEVEVEIDLVGSRANYDRWSFMSREKPSIGEEVWKTLEASGAAAAAARFRELRRTQPDAYNFGADQLGIAINRLMQRRRLDEALELLAAGIEAFPDESGFYARAGEAHAAAGRRDEAIRLYEKAQALAPHGTESMEMLRRLRGASSRPATR